MRIFGAWGLIGLQVAILATGNYTFFNLLTIALTLFLFDDQALARFVPAQIQETLIERSEGRIAAMAGPEGSSCVPTARLPSFITLVLTRTNVSPFLMKKVAVPPNLLLSASTSVKSPLILVLPIINTSPSSLGSPSLSICTFISLIACLSPCVSGVRASAVKGKHVIKHRVIEINLEQNFTEKLDIRQF